MTSTDGLAMRPRPMASICCSPPDSVPASWVAALGQAGQHLVDVLALLLDPGALSPLRPRADLEVALDGEAAEHPAALGHHHDPGLHARGRGPAGDVLAAVAHLRRRWRAPRRRAPSRRWTSRRR